LNSELDQIKGKRLKIEITADREAVKKQLDQI
jgi:hypothetical protein